MGIISIGKGGTSDDIALKRDVDWAYKSTINSAKKKNPKKNRTLLNKLGLSSHKLGTVKDQRLLERRDSNNGMPTENNVDSIMGIASTPSKPDDDKDKVSTVYGKRVVGYRETAYLSKDDDIEWIVMSESDYESQLILALQAKDRPKKVVKAAGKVMMDPQVFVKLVKAQEDTNNTKLVISFERNPKTIRKTGNLTVLVQNSKNIMRDSSRDRDVGTQDWTTRETRGSREPAKKGV